MAILIEPPQNELSALQNLSDSAGFLKKLGDGNYSIDNNNYLPLSGGNGSGLTSLNASNISTGTLNAARLPDSDVTAGTYNNSATQVRPFSIDVKGRITSIGLPVNITPPWSAITGKPTTLNGYGITNGQPLGNELTAIQALSDTPGFLKKTGDGSYSIDSNTYLPTSNEVNKYISTFRKTGTTNPAINLEDGEITIPDYSSFAINPPLTANTVAVLGSAGFAIGGCSLNGFSNNLSEIALALSGYSGKTTATENAVVIFNAAKHSGTTNTVALASNDIAFDFSNNFTTIVRISGNGNINASGRVASSSGFSVGSNQVVSARRTGWAAPTGTATRTTFAPATVTLPQLAERVKALIDDLTAHGLIGA
ncbi:hypothetical protein [Planktothrix agardhii]|uniref:Uncharacterized protein n=1 Tax=Planktothrix agardhii TaxID=1160 RepID=A0AAD1Q6F0_PLAAG|nr:hypothetical protein [Planktothrix agardhii]CAD5960826.1 hypothetical protein PANO66_03273 [Planktothrix agardhii]CAD5961312.1 hypothetical protein PANO66_03304 [Planktothrix agardhii]